MNGNIEAVPQSEIKPKNANIELPNGCIRIFSTLLFQLESSFKLGCSPFVLSIFQLLKSDIVTIALPYPTINYRYFQCKFV